MQLGGSLIIALAVNSRAHLINLYRLIVSLLLVGFSRYDISEQHALDELILTLALLNKLLCHAHF